MKVNRKRIIEEFLEITSIDSISYNERQMADILTGKLREIGFDVEEDEAGGIYNGTAGNLYAILEGEIAGDPILLSGHMDTVAPGIGKKSRLLSNDIIVSNKKTVLGGDDATALVEILEGIRSVREQGIKHRSIEILFPIAEEPYCRGSSVFNYSKIKSKDAYVLDMSGPVGAAVLMAPTIISFSIEVLGRAAHAGFEPEKGIHSIAVMSKGISNLRQGHIDEETTLNVGIISGGLITNSVPESCVIEGEIRSYDHDKALSTLEYVKKTFEDAVHGTGAELVFNKSINIRAYKVEENENVVEHFCRAASTLNIEPELTCTFGGSDANIFNEHGIRAIVLSCGMYNVHTTEEYTKVSDLETGARLVAKLITGQ